jgi:hypothetical protein
MATRDQVNGAFVNSATISANSLPIVDSHNRLLSIPVNIVFQLDLDLVFQPLPRPPRYPRYVSLDMEVVRTEIICEIGA